MSKAAAVAAEDENYEDSYAPSARRSGGLNELSVDHGGNLRRNKPRGPTPRPGKGIPGLRRSTPTIERLRGAAPAAERAPDSPSQVLGIRTQRVNTPSRSRVTVKRTDLISLSDEMASYKVGTRPPPPHVALILAPASHTRHTSAQRVAKAFT